MKKGDLVLIGVVILIALVFFSGKFLLGKAADETRLIISKDQVVLYNEELTTSSNDTITIGDDEAYNIVIIKDGSVVISEANCPNQVCVNDGLIKNVGDIIVCLPHRVMVEIKGNKTTSTDVISE